MNDEEITLVRNARPAGPPHDPAVKARAWARVSAELGAHPAGTAPNRRRRVLRGRGGWPLVLTGVVAAGAAAAIVATQVGGARPARQGRPYTTEQTLELAAETVEQQAALPRPRGDQWVYTQEITAYALQNGDVSGRDAMLRGKVKVEEWWRFDGTEMASSVKNGKLYVKGILRPGQSRPGRGAPRFNGGYIGGPGIVNETPHKLYDYVAGLPTDPDVLLTKVRRDYGDHGKDVTTFGVIAMIFREDHLIPPKTTATLYRALAKIHGVRVVRDATDYAGRHGVGVVFGTGARRKGKEVTEEIVLDADSYRYMGDRTQALITSRVVDKPGMRG